MPARYGPLPSEVASSRLWPSLANSGPQVEVQAAAGREGPNWKQAQQTTIDTSQAKPRPASKSPPLQGQVRISTLTLSSCRGLAVLLFSQFWLSEQKSYEVLKGTKSMTKLPYVALQVFAPTSVDCKALNGNGFTQE